MTSQQYTLFMFHVKHSEVFHVKHSTPLDSRLIRAGTTLDSR